MASVEVLTPFQIFSDEDGAPLDNGFIFIGAVNQNPETVPVNVYWDIDLTIPAAQPIRTLGGYPSRNGTPSRMFVAQSSHSILVANKHGTMVYSSMNSRSASDLEIRLAESGGSSMVGHGAGTVEDALDGVGALTGIDPTGVTAINSVLQTALTANDVVILPPGDFKLSSKINLKSGNVLRGSGHGATRIFRDTSVAPFDFFEGISVADVLISEIWFDSVQKEIVTNAANRRSAIRFWDNSTGIRCDTVEVIGCRFSKFTSAEIQAEGIRGVVTFEETNGFRVSGCLFDDNHATSIFWHDAKDGIVTDNRCNGETSTTDPFGLVGSFCSGLAEGVTVSNNRCTSTPYTSCNVSGTGVVVSGNTFISPVFSGVTISELLPAAVGVTITGNTIINPGLAGISVFEVNRADISGNVITGNASSSNGGIRLFESAAGNAPVNVTISGNEISGNVGVGIRINAGVNIAVIGNKISSNSTGVFVSNDATSALTALVKGNYIFDNTNFGVELSAGATGTQVVTIDENVFVSSNIATLQATGIVTAGALSSANLGKNSFSTNYDTNLIETVFANRATKALLQLSPSVMNAIKLLDGINYIATAVYDPPSLAAGAQATTNVSVAGASVGDFVDVGFSNDLQGIQVTGFVNAGSSVTAVFRNGTAGTIDLASGTLTVRVRKI